MASARSHARPCFLAKQVTAQPGRVAQAPKRRSRNHPTFASGPQLASGDFGGAGSRPSANLRIARSAPAQPLCFDRPKGGKKGLGGRASAGSPPAASERSQRFGGGGRTWVNCPAKTHDLPRLCWTRGQSPSGCCGCSCCCFCPFSAGRHGDSHGVPDGERLGGQARRGERCGERCGGF